MLIICRILVTAIALAGGVAGLVGCGQKGVLFIPTEPAAANRATLPQILRPSPTMAAPPAAPASRPSTE